MLSLLRQMAESDRCHPGVPWLARRVEHEGEPGGLLARGVRGSGARPRRPLLCGGHLAVLPRRL